MSSVVNAIQNVVATVVSIALLPTLVVVAVVECALGIKSFEESMADSLESIFGFFGLNGEDVISTQVQDTRILEDSIDLLPATVALIHQKTQLGIIDILKAKTMDGKLTYNKAYRYGKEEFVDGLPYSNITIEVFPENAVITKINNTYGVNSELSDTKITTPTKEEWTYAWLKDSNNYSMTTGELTYSDETYIINYIEYNYNTDKYDIYIYREDVISTEVTTMTTVTITNIDDTTDNKNTLVEERTVETGAIQGVISDTTVEISNNDEVIDIDTEDDSYNETISTLPNYIGYFADATISIEAYGTYKYYIAVWNEVGSSENNTWIYLTGSGDTQLDNTQYISELDMLPIMTLKNNGTYIDSDTESTRYKETKAMLDLIGLDTEALLSALQDNPDEDLLMDTFVYFGLDLSDTSPVASKMIYNVVDYILAKAVSEGLVPEDTDYGQGNATFELALKNSHKAITREGPFNSALSWAYQTRKVHSGTIAELGECVNAPDGTNLVVSKQVTESEYVTYTLYEVFVVTVIDRGGLSAAATKSYGSEGGMVMPLSYNLISKFSPIEQMELFAKSLRMLNYAAEITHLEYYQTEGFITTIKVLVIVISVVLLVMGIPPIAGGTWSAWAANMAIAVGLGFAAMEAIKSTDNPYLKALYVAIATVAMAYGMEYMGDIDWLALSMFSVDMISFSVTSWVDSQLEELDKAHEDFSAEVETREDTYKSAYDSLNDGITTDFAQRLATYTKVSPIVKGVDASIYSAIQASHDLIGKSTGKMYETVYDFDKYYRIGIV